jgi:lambda family phage tail tape measure protein
MANVASTIVVNIQAAGAATAQTAIQGVGSAAQVASGLVKGLALALVGVGVDGFMEATKKALEFGDSLAETSAKLGVTAEELQRLQAISIDLNSDVDSLTSAFESSKEMIGLYELGSTKATKSIGLLGTEVKNAIRDGKSSSDVFLLQIKALSEYSDVNERAAVAQRAGLGSMIDLATAYADGKMTIDELKESMANANVISNENANKASNMNDEWDKLSRNLETEVKSAIIGNSDIIFDLTKYVIQGTTAVLNFFAAWHEGNSLLGSIAIANGDLTKKQVITQDLADATEKLNKAQRDVDGQGSNSAARGAAERARDKQLAVTKELQGRLEAINTLEQKSTELSNRVTENTNRLGETKTRPIGATTLTNDEKDSTSSSSAGRELERQQKAEERYAEHSQQVFENLAMAKMRIAADTTTNEIEKLRQLEATEISTADHQLKDAKLHGAELVQATELTEQLKVLIKQKYALKEKELIKESQQSMSAFIDEGENIVAKAENDKVKQVELSTRAQIKSYTDRYDVEIAKARAAGLATKLLEEEKANVVQALEKQKTEQLTRINGTYLEKLTQHYKDQTAQQGDITSQFTTKMVDVTTGAFDQIASGMTEMAISGKSSWTDMSMAIIKQIEMLIAKMLIMYAVQQLIGMVTGAAGGGAGGAISSTAAQNAATITPSFVSGSYANGGAFMNGVQTFANGDILTNSKMFPMAGGKMGLAGEAGPEAIMPLARGADGKLGVRTQGGSDGGINIGTINVTLQAKDDETSEEQSQRFAKAIREQLKQLVDTRITNAKRSGNILNPTQIQTAF